MRTRLVVLLSLYVVAVGALLGLSTDTPGWLRALAIAGVVVGVGMLLSLRHRRGGHRTRSTQPAVAVTGLAARNPALGRQIEDAQAVLNGSAADLLDADVVRRARSAITGRVHDADRLFGQEQHLVDAIGDLSSALDGRRNDSQLGKARGRVSELRTRRGKVEDDIATATAQLIRDVTRAQSTQARRVSRRRGALALSQARSSTDAASAGDLVFDDDQLTRDALHDAVTEVGTRLDARSELEDLTDRIDYPEDRA